jgi:hypothetical protein
MDAKDIQRYLSLVGKELQAMGWESLLKIWYNRKAETEREGGSNPHEERSVTNDAHCF